MLVGLGVYGVIWWVGRPAGNNSPDGSDNTGQQVDQLTQAEIDAQQAEAEVALEKYDAEVQAKADSIGAIDDFEALSEADQAGTGSRIMRRLIEEGNTELALQFIELFMTRTDNLALDAAKLCFQLAETSERQAYCREQANRIGLEQGIIAPGESLDDDYLNDTFNGG